MRLKDRTIEGDIIGKPLLTFSNELTKEAVADLATKIEYMDGLYRLVDSLLSDGHIKSILEGLEKLQEYNVKYKYAQMQKRMKLKSPTQFRDNA